MGEVDRAQDQAQKRAVLAGDAMGEVDRPGPGAPVLDRLADERAVGGFVAQREKLTR